MSVTIRNPTDKSAKHKNKKNAFANNGKKKSQNKKSLHMKPTLNQRRTQLATSNNANKKIVFDDEGTELSTNEKVVNQKHKKNNRKKQQNAEETKAIEVSKKQTKITFTDEGEAKPVALKGENDEDDENDYFVKREKQRKSKEQQNADNEDASQKKWYQVYEQYPCDEEILDMKDTQQMELYNLCKNAFEAEKFKFNKRNPSDGRWLQTALHKGTAKDRANAGALLVTTNPLGNLEALNNLIGFCKISNKSSNDVIGILTELWKEVLLPPQRKLYSIQMRAADWKHLLKDTSLTKDKQRHIYAYWYFENELKDYYFEFLKNVMQGLQTGQDHNKSASIVAASQLLTYAPEKEQMLLSMLINKLGDPVAKIASKALHHLSEVAHRHPNMCSVIVTEAEKLLFRNNISERAQHFTLCFLASIAPAGRTDVCTKLVSICFSLFKVLVQKGVVNSRTMQAILRCLQRAILEAEPSKGSSELLNKEMQDTIYRLVHLADIRISVQTLGLLLQLVSVKTEKSDRFYNALYVKLCDLNLVNIGSKTAAQLLHIVHRAIHIDKHVARAQAFVKRLLQLALYTPPHITAGCLIVTHKLLRMRPELEYEIKAIAAGAEKLENDVVPTEEANALETVAADVVTTYDEIMNNDTSKAEKHAAVAKYNPYNRVPAFAGAEYAPPYELLLLQAHHHPTVQVFATNILNKKRIDYYGDPLRDFALSRFLERFSFKNPKKFDDKKPEIPAQAHKHYVAFGARGRPVKSLTKATCTEDEMFILNFLEQKRERAAKNENKKLQKKLKIENDEGDGNEQLMEGEVDDDEFETYLSGYFGKKAKEAAEGLNSDGDNEDDLDFLTELGGALKADKDKKTKKQKKKIENDGDDDDIEDIDADWGDDNDVNVDDDNDDFDEDDAEFGADDSDMSDDETGSIDLQENAEENDSENGNDNDDDSDSFGASNSDEDVKISKPNNLKRKKPQAPMINERGFNKKLKESSDMASLFAAADDFAELLEETGKTKGQGTINAVYNKDKSSDKQMKWEEKRHSNAKQYLGKNAKPTRNGSAKLSKKHKK